ncbi:hypothetical protein ACTXJR_07370 [Glutamicibacter ardleyensis]
MSIVANHYRFIVGVDTYAATYTYATLESASGRIRAQEPFPTNSMGLA